MPAADDPRFSDAWRAFRAANDPDEYASRWDRLAADGRDVHGEAGFVASLGPRTVLDAGCGAGRVAIELHRRGIEVIGVDLDPDLLARARDRAPDLTWIHADLAELDQDLLARALGRPAPPFDVVVMAGNVLPFVEPSRRGTVVHRCATLLAPRGALVSGAGLTRGWPSVGELDDWCRAAGLDLTERFAGWGREPWDERATYAVSVHRRPHRGRAPGPNRL